MARSKPDTIRPIGDLVQANAALAEIASIKRDLSAIEAEMNAAIDRIKAEADAGAAPLQERIKSIEGGLQAYAAFHKKVLFADRRSKELDHGTIGFRKSNQIKTKTKVTWQMVLARLKELKFNSAIRTKEDVNKEELQGWPDERLELVGARRVNKDQFWYEVNEEKIADKAQAV
jgi:phage host-nuclease inhibitor protein Gam